MEHKEKSVTLSKLASFNHMRAGESFMRPNIEFVPDPWIDWVSSHRRNKKGESSRDSEGFSNLLKSPVFWLGHH